MTTMVVDENGMFVINQGGLWLSKMERNVTEFSTEKEAAIRFSSKLVAEAVKSEVERHLS